MLSPVTLQLSHFAKLKLSVPGHSKMVVTIKLGGPRDYLIFGRTYTIVICADSLL